MYQVGTTPYNSKVTGKVEDLPVAMSIIGEPGKHIFVGRPRSGYA